MKYQALAPLALAVAIGISGSAFADDYDSLTHIYTIDQPEGTADGISISGPWSAEAAARANPIAVFRVNAVEWDEDGGHEQFEYLTSGSADSEIPVLAGQFDVNGVSSLTSGNTTYILFVHHLLDNNTLRLLLTDATYRIGTALTGKGTLSIVTGSNGPITAPDGTANDAAVKFTVTSSSAARGTRGGSGSGSSSSGGSSSASGNSGSGSAAVIDEASLKLSAQRQTYGVVMAQNAGSILLNHGLLNDLNALSALSGSKEVGFQPFFSIYGGAARNDTDGDSHVNLQALEFTAGAGFKKILANKGTLASGAFFETGFGTFKNHFNADYADNLIDKKGHGNYTGLGVNLEYVSPSKWHVDGIMRGGRVKMTQNNALYNASYGTTAGYEISSEYFGLELGGGKIFTIGNNDLDVYARYFYLHQDGDDFRVTGDHYKLSSVDTHILKAGVTENYHFKNGATLYAGVGYEQSIDGKSELKVKASDGSLWYKSGSADLGGGRGFAEGGVRFNAVKALDLNFSIRGSAGSDYRDVTGRAEARYEF